MATSDTDRDERRRLRRQIGRLRGQIDRRGGALIGQLRPLAWLWNRWISSSIRREETPAREEKQ